MTIRRFRAALAARHGYLLDEWAPHRQARWASDSPESTSGTTSHGCPDARPFTLLLHHPSSSFEHGLSPLHHPSPFFTRACTLLVGTTDLFRTLIPVLPYLRFSFCHALTLAVLLSWTSLRFRTLASSDTIYRLCFTPTDTRTICCIKSTLHSLSLPSRTVDRPEPSTPMYFRLVITYA